jgi:predicted nucleic-acid-binding protein
MHAVDTNVLVRLATRDDEKQYAVALRFVANGVWVSHIALVEMTWVLRTGYQFAHAEIAAIIDLLLEHSAVTIQDADIVVLALKHYRRRPSLGFSDCLVLEVARKAGHMPLGTFDRSLSKLDGVERLS